MDEMDTVERFARVVVGVDASHFRDASSATGCNEDLCSNDDPWVVSCAHAGAAERKIEHCGKADWVFAMESLAFNDGSPRELRAVQWNSRPGAPVVRTPLRHGRPFPCWTRAKHRRWHFRCSDSGLLAAHSLALLSRRYFAPRGGVNSSLARLLTVSWSGPNTQFS